MGEELVSKIIDEGYIDAADDIWPRLGLVSKKTRRTGGNNIIESLIQDAEKAGGITKHRD